MGMLLAIIAIVVAFAGACVGAAMGFILGLAIEGSRKKSRERPRSGSTVTATLLGTVLGMVLACAGAGYWLNNEFYGDGPPHGYPNRAAYRTAELDARSAKLEPLIAALASYKKKHNRYPTDLTSLVTEQFLTELPPERLPQDHQGVSGRIMSSEKWYKYTLDADGMEYTLDITCSFTEDRRGMGVFYLRYSYQSKLGSWQTFDPQP